MKQLITLWTFAILSVKIEAEKYSSIHWTEDPYWRTNQQENGWSWDELDAWVEFGKTTVSSTAKFPENLQKLKEYQRQNADLFTKNLAMDLPAEYNQELKNLLFSAHSIVVKITMHGNRPADIVDWTANAEFAPFVSNEPPPLDEIEEGNWIHVNLKWWMFAIQELFGKMGYPSGKNEEYLTALYSSEIIIITEDRIEQITRHLARYDSSVNSTLDKFPDEADLTKMEWEDIPTDKKATEELKGKFPDNLFRYPGPPRESDWFDLIADTKQETGENYGHKQTKSGWHANQFSREGPMKTSQRAFRHSEFLAAKTQAEFIGCNCIHRQMESFSDPMEMLTLFKMCRQELYSNWNKMAAAARLSSCVIDDPNRMFIKMPNGDSATIRTEL